MTTHPTAHGGAHESASLRPHPQRPRRLACLAWLALAPPLALAQQPARITLLEVNRVFSFANADYNGDGLIDVFGTGHDPLAEVIWYSQPDGSFVASAPFPGTKPTGGRIDRHGCTPADFNLDGRMDVFCAVGASKGHGHGNSELWLQNADGSFARDNQSHGATDPFGRGRIPVAFHFNKGRSPDLFATNEGIPRDDGRPNLNHVYLNNGTGKFREVKTVATVAIAEATCQGKGDVNHDGRDDLFVCPWLGNALIYVNNGRDEFELLPLPMADQRWWTMKLARIDDDAFEDLVVTTLSGKLQVFRNTHVRTAPFGAAPDWEATLPNPNAVSTAVGDLNGDGIADIYVAMREVVDFDHGPDCKSGEDPIDDVVFMSRGKDTQRLGWRMVPLVQGYRGCGHAVDYIGQRRVVLSQGGPGWRGPVLVLDWTPRVEADPADYRRATQ